MVPDAAPSAALPPPVAPAAVTPDVQYSSHGYTTTSGSKSQRLSNAEAAVQAVPQVVQGSAYSCHSYTSSSRPANAEAVAAAALLTMELVSLRGSTRDSSAGGTAAEEFDIRTARLSTSMTDD